MGKPIVHFEIGCRDKDKTTRFYTDLFDWTAQDVDHRGKAGSQAEGGKGKQAKG